MGQKLELKYVDSQSSSVIPTQLSMKIQIYENTLPQGWRIHNYVGSAFRIKFKLETQYTGTQRSTVISTHGSI